MPTSSSKATLTRASRSATKVRSATTPALVSAKFEVRSANEFNPSACSCFSPPSTFLIRPSTFMATEGRSGHRRSASIWGHASIRGRDRPFVAKQHHAAVELRVRADVGGHVNDVRRRVRRGGRGGEAVEGGVAAPVAVGRGVLHIPNAVSDREIDEARRDAVLPVRIGDRVLESARCPPARRPACKRSCHPRSPQARRRCRRLEGALFS